MDGQDSVLRVTALCMTFVLPPSRRSAGIPPRFSTMHWCVCSLNKLSWMKGTLCVSTGKDEELWELWNLKPNVLDLNLFPALGIYDHNKLCDRFSPLFLTREGVRIIHISQAA
jgi:hypothetical protein